MNQDIMSNNPILSPDSPKSIAQEDVREEIQTLDLEKEEIGPSITHKELKEAQPQVSDMNETVTAVNTAVTDDISNEAILNAKNEDIELYGMNKDQENADSSVPSLHESEMYETNTPLVQKEENQETSLEEAIPTSEIEYEMDVKEMNEAKVSEEDSKETSEESESESIKDSPEVEDMSVQDNIADAPAPEVEAVETGDAVVEEAIKKVADATEENIDALGPEVETVEATEVVAIEEAAKEVADISREAEEATEEVADAPVLEVETAEAIEEAVVEEATLEVASDTVPAMKLVDPILEETHQTSNLGDTVDISSDDKESKAISTSLESNESNLVETVGNDHDGGVTTVNAVFNMTPADDDDASLTTNATNMSEV